MTDITICTGIKDRTDYFFKCVIASLNECKQVNRIGLSMFDAGSKDYGRLVAILKERWHGELIINREDVPFARAYTFNKAVKQAKTDKVFLCDADMILPRNFVELYDAYVDTRSVWFPICFSLKKGRPAIIAEENGYWRKPGHGMVGIHKDVYLKLGGLDEKFKTYGEEDGNFFSRVVKAGYNIHRTNCRGLFHEWHESDSGHH